jgi:hypothetical protein
MDLTIVAYATLALSLFVSAVKMGGWILNADPRAIINSGRWALVALAALALGVLVWLLATGRWTPAMMLAAFMLPVFVQAAPRWRVLFGPLNTARGDFAAGAQNFGSVPASWPRQGPDPELVRQSIAVLRAYVEQAGPQLEYRPAEPANCIDFTGLFGRVLQSCCFDFVPVCARQFKSQPRVLHSRLTPPAAQSRACPWPRCRRWRPRTDGHSGRTSSGSKRGP